MGRTSKYLPASVGHGHLQRIRTNILRDPEGTLEVLIGESEGREETFAFAHPNFKGFYCPACQKGPFRISTLAVHYGKRNSTYQCSAMEQFLNNQIVSTEPTMTVKSSTPTKVSYLLQVACHQLLLTLLLCLHQAKLSVALEEERGESESDSEEDGKDGSTDDNNDDDNDDDDDDDDDDSDDASNGEDDDKERKVAAKPSGNKSNSSGTKPVARRLEYSDLSATRKKRSTKRKGKVYHATRRVSRRLAGKTVN